MLLFSGWRGARVWTAITIVTCAGILLSSGVYFTGGPTPRFLLEKGTWAQQPWWLASFYLHVISASLCLATGVPLMFPSWTRKHPAWHRVLGYIYLNVVLWLAAPTGIAMSTVAKGGLWGTLGFALTGALWWQSTWSGYRAIRRGDIEEHVRWMVRSFCWALSAPAFRLIQAGLFFCGLDDGSNYVLSLWLSMVASVVLSESFLLQARRESRPLFPIPVPR